MGENNLAVVIVGGGTSGWLAALSLTKRLRSPIGGSVTVVESPQIPTIGVGESTIPYIRRTLSSLDIDEDEFMRETDATFKVAIHFRDWACDRPSTFWSPFGPFPQARALEDAIGYHVRRFGPDTAFDYSAFPSIRVAKDLKAPKFGTEPPYSGNVHYAYHLDAGLLAKYLKREALSRGVVCHEENVVDVVVGENGIERVVTDSQRSLIGDLFVDCSGFRGLLINEALDEPFVSYGHYLPCDRAIAMRLPNESAHSPIPPYTTATALRSGWAWDIPLYNRRGTGYVYSSSFISDDDAQAEFLKHLGIDETKSTWMRRLKMRVGRTRRSWVGNCVSLGLAAGFIEPLESTSIFLTEVGLAYLDAHFPDRSVSAALSRSYNRYMEKIFDEVRDFVIFHYFTSQRSDTDFWRARSESSVPSSVEELLELWDNIDFSSTLSISSLELFSAMVFSQYLLPCILLGVGRVPLRARAPLSLLLERSNIFQTASAEQLNLPSHSVYLSELHAGTVTSFRERFVGASTSAKDA